MSILSSILGIGGNQPQPVAGPALATQKIPEELAPYYKDILGKAQALYKEKTAEGFQPYQGPTIAQFTPEQEQAFTGLAGLTGQQAPVFQEAMDMTRAAAAPMTSEQVTEYMSPYQQAVVDIEKREAQKQYESQVVPQLAAKAATTGGFGGSRQAILEGMAADTQQRLLGDIQAKGSQQAYEDAVRRFQTDRQASGQAGAQLAQMAPAQFKAQLGEFGALQTVGEQRQRQAQTALDEAFRQYTREQEYPYTTLGRYQATVTGAPIGTTQFAAPTPPPPTLGQTLIGGLGTAAGLYGQFTGKNPLSLITGKKHGGGLSDLPVVHAQNGNLISQYLRRMGINLPRRGDNVFPAEITGDEIEFNYGDEKKRKIEEATERQRQESQERKERSANVQHPLLAFDSSQAGRRSSIEMIPGEEEASGMFGMYGERGPDRLARIPRDITTQGYGLDNKEDPKTLDEINADIVEKLKKKQEINEIPIRDVGVINQPPPDRVPPSTPQLDRVGMSEQIAIQQKEDALREAMAAQAGRYDERLANIDDERTRDQYGNLASFFARMGTATPRRGGLLGVVDAAMQVGPESISAMKETNKEFRDRRESLEDKREDVKLIAMKEDLGMALSKRDRRIKSEAVKFEKDKWEDQLKIYKDQNEIARIEAGIPEDIKDAYINNLNDYSKDLIGTITNFKGKDFHIRDGKITGKRGPAILAQIEAAKSEAQEGLIAAGGRWDSWVESGGLNKLQKSINEIIGIDLQASSSDSDSDSAEIKQE